MRLPRLVAGVLVARQAANLLPSTFCSPECPSCKTDVIAFDGAITSCTPNSSFIEDCGHCQSCVEEYAIDNGDVASFAALEVALSDIVNLCATVPAVSTEIQALQSQASRFSALGAVLASTTGSATMTGSLAITSAPTATATSGSAAKTSSSSKPTQSSTPTPLSPTWIAGPVLGSVMGIGTVIIVIFFTRRKRKQQDMQSKAMIKMDEIEKPKLFDNDADSAASPAAPEKARVHAEVAAEIAAPVEAEVHEVHELPAVEPVGSELSTPIFARTREDVWPVSPMTPMPLSPLPLLFAAAELRDQRNGVGDKSPKHDTFYHP
ncbi:hypothetical protein V8E51_014625 [Hyaloscypha variabilis]